MPSWRTYIMAGLLFGAVFCRADSTPSRGLTTAEYRAELDGLLAAIQQLDRSGASTPDALQHLPQSWPVHTEQADFQISTEGLRRDVRRYDRDKNLANAYAIRMRLQSLRHEVEGFDKTPPDVSARRNVLDTILARPEFSDVHGPTWTDRLKRWILEKLIRFLGRLFRSSAVPTIGKYLVYALVGIAGLALLYLA